MKEQSNGKVKTSTKSFFTASHSGALAILRVIITLIVAGALIDSAFAQSVSIEKSQAKAARQSSEATAAVLENATKTGSLVDAIIEIPSPLKAADLDNVALPGEIQSIQVVSTTSAWRGAIYSTPDSPIISLAVGLRAYEQLYRDAGPNDPAASFAMTTVTVRGLPSEIVRARESLTGAAFVSVKEVPGSDSEDAKSAPELKSATATVTVAEQAASASAVNTAFVPSNAELNIQTLANSDRRIDVKFSWNKNQDLLGLSKDRSTLEVQVLFWNHAANASANNVSYVGRMKIWGANNTFFHSYFDTPALNGLGIGGSPYEREVTIGSYDARSDFQAGKQYSVWTITEKGALDANFAKLSFQRGLFMPSLIEDFAVNRACELNYQRTGIFDPAFCVSGLETVKVTPTNYTGTNYSILAPTIPSFAYPTPTCSIPPGYPGYITAPSRVTEQAAQILAPQILAFQNAFSRNLGRANVGCATNFVHPDSAWWPRGGFTQNFDGSQNGKGAGAIMLAPSAGQAFWIHGAIWTRYSSTQFGGPKSVVGEPTGDERSVTSSQSTAGAYQAFTKGYLYFNTPRNQVYYVVNAIAQKYQSIGLHTDQLGFPISDEYAWNGGARNDFEGGYIYWTAASGAVIVRNQPASLPTIAGYTWDRTPTGGQPFNGTITGTNFIVNGTSVFFCVNGSSTCYLQPAAGVNVTRSDSLNVSNVNLSAGSWQIYVQTSAGSSTKSAVFTVQAPASLPTVAGYTWDRTPTGGQPFNGTITGTNFVVNGTSVFFCVNGSNTCYQQPAAGVNVTGSGSLNVSNVNLSAGSWQIYVQTSAGASAKSTAFTVQAPPSQPTITGYSWDRTLMAGQAFNGTITGSNFVVNGTSVFFCLSGTSTCYQHPAAGVNVTGSGSLNASNVNLGAGSWQIYVQTSAGSSAKSTAFTVQAPPSPPTITGYSWDRTPIAGQAFNGTIAGSNFVVNGTSVFFCLSGTSTCYQHPAAGVNVNSSTSLNVSSVNLGAGSWQVYVQTSAGASARSASFTVQAPASPPTVSSYVWDRTPTAGQFFNGTIYGSNFVAGATSVFFCVSGSSTCYQQPAAGVNVTSSTSLNVNNVNLSAGSWQIYVQTGAGASARSAAFTVQPSPPAITSYSWTSTPTGGQPFNGSIYGSNFVIGGTQVWFCVANTATCYQHPAAGVNVINSTTLNVSNVNLSTGSWQIFLQTSAGQSGRSTAFSVR